MGKIGGVLATVLPKQPGKNGSITTPWLGKTNPAQSWGEGVRAVGQGEACAEAKGPPPGKSQRLGLAVSLETPPPSLFSRGSNVLLCEWPGHGNMLMGMQRQEGALTHHKGSFPPQHSGLGHR